MEHMKDGFAGQQILVIPKRIVDEMEDSPSLSLLHITDIGYFPKAERHYRERLAPINQHVLIYCIDGSGWYRINDRTYTVAANQFFILPAGEIHAYGSDENNPWTIYWVHFKGKTASIYCDEIQGDAPIDIKPDINSRINERILLFDEIYNTLKSGYTIDNLRYSMMLFHHFLGTMFYVQQFRNATERQPEHVDIVDGAIHFMKENMGKRITLTELAEYTGYSTPYLSSLFKQKTGQSPMSYFNLLKVQHACSLLDNTDLKINQICFKVGIDDMFYFSRLFSKYMGMSPSEYRNIKKG